MYVNTLARCRNARFLREEGEGGGGGAGAEQGKEQQGKEQQGKYTPPATQEEFDRIVQDRVRRAEAKYADYETWKAKGEQYDVLAEASKTDLERDLAEAREEAFHEAMSTAVPRMVRQAFRAEAKGVLSAEQLESLLEDLDLVKYATDKGEPDEEKIAKKVAAFAPANGGSGRQQQVRPGFGQGGGHQTSTARKGEKGLEEARRRFGDKVATS